MKRAWWLSIGVVVWWWWPSEPARPANVQAAVITNGFAAVSDRRIVELDREGKTTHEMPLRIDGEVRVVGTRAGTAIGWRDGKKIKLAQLDSDGNPEDVSSWGKRAQQLCDGVASNEYRFGVGWLEGDQSVWFVGGPLQRVASIESTTKVTWCGIASADKEVVLIWRDGKKLMMDFCDKQCSPQITKVPVDPDQLIGFGCARSMCLFASRDKAGAIRIHRVNENGRAIVKQLDAETDSIAIVGAGPQAFAIAYAMRGHTMIERVAADLTVKRVWQLKTETAPSIAWANDRLLVAQPGAFHVLELPR